MHKCTYYRFVPETELNPKSPHWIIHHVVGSRCYQCSCYCVTLSWSQSTLIQAHRVHGKTIFYLKRPEVEDPGKLSVDLRNRQQHWFETVVKRTLYRRHNVRSLEAAMQRPRREAIWFRDVGNRLNNRSSYPTHMRLFRYLNFAPNFTLTHVNLVLLPLVLTITQPWSSPYEVCEH